MMDEQANSLFPPTTNIKQLVPIFQKFDQLSSYILVQIFRTKSDLFGQSHPEHLQNFLDWVSRCAVKAQNGSLRYGREALQCSTAQRKNVIDQLSYELEAIVEAQLIKRIYDNLSQIFEGETSGLQVALKDNLLAELYISGIGISGGYPQLLRLVDLMAHKYPSMKILEIGAGTGGATRLIMNTLEGRSQFKRYKGYCFTDVSTSFLSAAQNEFSECGSMQYKLLDIEKHPFEQGFESEYDMIIASQVLHATTKIAETLQHARSLLKPGGRMILLEITNVHLGTGLVLGTFPDYWNGVGDGRIDSPLLTKSMWQDALVQNGFSGIDILLDDHESPVSMASVIVTTAVGSQLPAVIKPATESSITLVYSEVRPSFSNAVESLALEKGHGVQHVSISDSHLVKHNSRVIVLADLLGNFLMDMDAAGLECLKTLFRNSSSLVWVTAGGLIDGSRPENALIGGLIRAIITEMPNIRISTLDLDPEYDQTSDSLAETVLSIENVLQHSQGQPSAVDSEYYFKDGVLHISRLGPDTTLNERFLQREGLLKDFKIMPLEGQNPLGLNFDQAGLLSSMYFEEDRSFSVPLKDDHIEISTKAVGLNVKVSHLV